MFRRVMVILSLVAILAMSTGLANAAAPLPFQWPPTKDYLVQPGDTYIKIASQNGLREWKNLQRLNGWVPEAIPVGAAMKVPEPWVLVTTSSRSEAAGALALLENVASTTIDGRGLNCGRVTTASGKKVAVCVSWTGVADANVIQWEAFLYNNLGTHPEFQMHGGINGGFYEVGSSIVPKKVCKADSYFNYPVLSPGPIWPWAGETPNSLAKRLGWTEAELKEAIARNSGKFPASMDQPFVGDVQLVSPRDDTWNDKVIPRGVTVYTHEGKAISVNPPCWETPDWLYNLGVTGAQTMIRPTVPVTITDYIKSQGRDPAKISVFYGPNEVLCAGDTFYASPVTAYIEHRILGCNGMDMETPTVSRQVQTETGDTQPAVVYFRTSSDPPNLNPGKPQVTFTQYLEDRVTTYGAARLYISKLFSLPVTAHQAAWYGQWVKAVLNAWAK